MVLATNRYERVPVALQLLFICKICKLLNLQACNGWRKAGKERRGKKVKEEEEVKKVLEVLKKK